MDLFDNGDNEEVGEMMEITIPPFAQGSPTEEVYRSSHLSFMHLIIIIYILNYCLSTGCSITSTPSATTP